jgi:DNA-binding NarL/FixJ family response regulator
MRLVLCDDNRIFCEALAVALEARPHQAPAVADEGVAAVLVVSGLTDRAATLAPRRGPSPTPDPGSQRADDPLSTLTPRETEVLRRIAAGQNTKKMAGEMNVTTETLRTYVKNVLGKLGAHSRLEAAALASRQIPPGQHEPDGDHPLLAALTPREREVLMHVTKGSGFREVAKQLHMSLKTVNTHLHNLRSKLGVHSTLEAVALARSAIYLTERAPVSVE